MLSARPRRFEVRSILLWFQRNTIVALILLLLLFVAIVELLKPGTVNPVWLSNTLLFAAPLGILAAGQTHGDVDRRDRSVGRQRRHRLGVPDDDDGAASSAMVRRSRSASGSGSWWERSMASASLCSAFSRW